METSFRLASCSKPITATAVMQLYERGALDIDDTAPSGGNPNGPWESNTMAYAFGALYASVRDMFYFNYAFYSGALIRLPDTIKKVHSRHRANVVYGFMIEPYAVGHNGLITGDFTSQLDSFPSNRGLIMVLSNGSGNATTYAR